jgi:hypothetical protein
MSAGWVAVSVRARAMTRRRLGHGTARNLAASPSLDAALAMLLHSPYGHDVGPGQTLAEAQHAVVDSAVWNLRVLAGWAPPDGVAMLRALLSAVEAANVEDHLQRLARIPTPPPYRLGRIDTAWTRLGATTSPDDLRRVLATSAWGDPGGVTAREVALAMRTATADRVIAAAPAAATWATASTALLIAREVVLGGRDLPPRARESAVRVLGRAAPTAHTLPELARALPASARWALADVAQPDDLWRAEARWWVRVERDGFALARRAAAGAEVLVGTVALLAADAWRVRGALELAARGGAPLEVFDAVA